MTLGVRNEKERNNTFSFVLTLFNVFNARLTCTGLGVYSLGHPVDP